MSKLGIVFGPRTRVKIFRLQFDLNYLQFRYIEVVAKIES